MECKKCGQSKKVEDFYPFDKYWCKECRKKYTAKWQKKNPEKIKNYSKKHYLTEKSKAWRKKYRENNREKMNEYTRRWQKENPERYKKLQKKHRATEKYKLRRKEYHRKWYAKYGRKRASDYCEKAHIYRKNNIEETRISALTRYYIKKGIIKKKDTCEKCEKKAKLIAHHPDYQFPFKIIWLCYSCHKIIHQKK